MSRAGGDGELQLQGIRLEAWHSLERARCWDDPDKEDPHPGAHLDALLARVRTALLGWMDCLDHLVPGP